MIRRALTRLILLNFGFGLSFFGSEMVANGQGNTFNPFGNSGYADYREFTTPMYSNDPSLPGQARLQSNGLAGRNRVNQFESYVNSLDNADRSDFDRRPPSGVPHYQAQRFSSQGRQGYRPNDSAAEREYQAQVKARNDAYEKALAEKDPRKRAIKIQQLERQDVTTRFAAKGARATSAPPVATPNRKPATAPPTSAVSASASTPRPGTTTNQPENVPATNPSAVAIPAPR